MAPERDVTVLLERWRSGDREAADALVSATYDQMRRVARSFFRQERRDHTLQPTALVHEAYLRLFQDKPVSLESREAFFRLLASQMRRQLIDHARRRSAGKRGGDMRKGSLDEYIDLIPAALVNSTEDELQALDGALEQLGAEHPRVANIIQLRYFADMSLDEVAATMKLSAGTIKRELSFARAWLARALTQS